MRRALGVLVGVALLLAMIAWSVRARFIVNRVTAPAEPARSPQRRTAPTPSIRLLDARVESDASAGGELLGRVVSVTTGEGVAHATLTFFHEGAALTTSGDATGNFRFRAPAPGRYELASAVADGYLPFEPELGQSPIAFDARAGVRLTGVTLYLTPKVRYDGHVVDGAGKPVPGAEVRVVEPAADEHWTSDEKGDFVFSAPDGAMLEARHPSRGRGRAALDLAAESARSLTIKIVEPVPPAAAPIAGVVVDAHGPADGALLSARCDGLHPATQTRSGADGRFELRGLDDCAHRVTATLRDHQAARADGVRPGTRDLRLELGAGAAVRGRVVDGAGRPVPAFTVMARRKRGALERGEGATRSFIDSEGRFELRGLEGGPNVLQAAANGLAPSEERTVEAPGEVELTLSRGGRVSGRVIDRATKQPLAGARVSVEGGIDVEQTIAPLASGVATDGDGQFVLGGLPPGLCSITVAAAGHNPRLISGLRLSPEGELGPLTIDLAAVAPGEEPRMEFVGIGAVLRAEGDVMLIVDVMPGGGAAEVGLAPGDAVLSIDGTPAGELGFAGSVQRIRGPEGSTVELVVRKKDGTTGPLAVPRRALNRR